MNDIDKQLDLLYNRCTWNWFGLGLLAIIIVNLGLIFAHVNHSHEPELTSVTCKEPQND